MAKNWSKNVKGEFEYHFYWMDENGQHAGWNSVYAPTMAEARKRARLKESPAKDFSYGIINADGSKGTSTERFKGLYINPKTFKRVTLKQSYDTNVAANRLML